MNSFKLKIMVIDDEKSLLYTLESYLENYQIKSFSNGREGLEELKKKHYDILLVDYKMPGMSGLDFLIEARKIAPNVKSILISAYADREILETFINETAIYNFIEKPVQKAILLNNIQKLALRIKNEIIKSRDNHKSLSTGITAAQQADQINPILIPNSAEYQKVYNQATIAFENRLALLINGETGTGKEVLVKRLQHTIFPKKKLVIVDCGAIPENLIESELFGYVKGAFTGANQDKIGKIEYAHNGIMFLDEISNAPLTVQNKLLRVIQDKKVCRIGTTKETKVDFILVTATNIDLQEQISKNKFKEDLYYRIKQVEIALPPLRSDKDTLVLFIIHLINTYNEIYAADFKPDNDFYELLLQHSWPGNLRELDNEIRKAILYHKMNLNYSLKIITEAQRQKNTVPGKKSFLNEKERIIKGLVKHNFNISKAAKYLNIGRTTLYQKMEKYQINKEDFTNSE